MQLELKDLTKKYGNFTALDRMTITFTPGIYGILGANGAGKSTTVKLLTGILTPTGGTCTVDGHTPWANRKEHVRHLGAVFGQRTQLWWDVPIRDSFLLLRDIYDIDHVVWQKRLDALVDALELGEFLNAPLRQLSLGQRMRAELCGSLLHQPRLLFLDEPTLGLDVLARSELWDVIRSLQGKVTIILTTHYMEEAQALSDRIGILKDGHLLAVGTAAELMDRAGTGDFETAFVSIVKEGRA